MFYSIPTIRKFEAMHRAVHLNAVVVTNYYLVRLVIEYKDCLNVTGSKNTDVHINLNMINSI